MCISLWCRKLDCGDDGQEDVGLSVSLKGSSFTVIVSDNLPHAELIEIDGKHSSSMSAGIK